MTSATLTRAQILASLSEAMRTRGWSLQSFSGLPEVFAKTELVTPYCGIGDIRPFKEGWYGLGGYLGVVHQEFEEIWTAREENRGRRSLFPVCLLTANLAALREVAYVRANSLAEDTDRFARVLTEILGEMPQSEVDLKAAFEKGQLLDRPITDFSGYSQRPKFAEFRQFVERLA